MKRGAVVIALVVVGLAVLAVGATAQSTYISAQKCKMCHKLQFESWQTTPHAKATEAAKASTERAFDPSCLSCHATNQDEALSGVQCEACHGPGSEYKSLSIMKDAGKAKAAGLVMPDQKTCDGCHDGADHHKKVAFTRDVHAHKD